QALTLRALAAARVAATEVWKREGDPSPAHPPARTPGSSVGAAGDAIAAARRLEGLPAASAAARRGELSTAQLAAIAEAASADPSAEGRLVEAAGRPSLRELKDDCARTTAAASSDAEARRRRIHDERRLR